MNRVRRMSLIDGFARLLAMGLELPEETFVNQHNFEGEGMTFCEYMNSLWCCC